MESWCLAPPRKIVNFRVAENKKNAEDKLKKKKSKSGVAE